MIGLTVSHYHVLEKIGEGGMGVVYRAEDIRLGRTVAIKALPRHFVSDPLRRKRLEQEISDPLRRKRLEQEARVAGSIYHSAIATIHDLAQDGEDLYVVMEYVQGQSLRSLVLRGSVGCSTVISIATQLAEGLAAAHAMGIVHRDLKPENILVTDSKRRRIPMWASVG